MCVYTYIPKCIDTTCSVSVMLLVCLFPGLTIWYGITNLYAFLWRNYFSHSLPPGLSLVHFGMFSLVLILPFKQSCWWDFKSVAFDITGRHNSQQTPWSAGSCKLSNRSSAMNHEPWVQESFVDIVIRTGLHNCTFLLVVGFYNGVQLSQRKVSLLMGWGLDLHLGISTNYLYNATTYYISLAEWRL